MVVHDYYGRSAHVWTSMEDRALESLAASRWVGHAIDCRALPDSLATQGNRSGVHAIDILPVRKWGSAMRFKMTLTATVWLVVVATPVRAADNVPLIKGRLFQSGS